MAGSSAAQEACHHLPNMPPWCPDPAPCQETESPGSQAVQLEGSKSDSPSRFDNHPVGSCLEGAVVGSVGCQSSVPSAVLRPSLNLLQNPLLQKPQSIHQSLRKALLAWDNWKKKPKKSERNLNITYDLLKHLSNQKRLPENHALYKLWYTINKYWVTSAVVI